MTSPIKARYDTIVWKGEADAEYLGLNFYFEPAYGVPPPKDKVFVFKPRSFFETYAEVLGNSPTRNVFELGIWLGGSALALAGLLDVEKLVCIDKSHEIMSFDAVLATHPLGQRIRPYYLTSQDDEEKLNAILDAEFNGPPDVIFDDASHWYGPSRASFEILYPRLRPGGWYIIEDWGWAHQTLPIWPEEPSLAGLIFELQLVMACTDLIDHMIVKREMVMIKKPETESVSRKRLSIQDLYTLHHRSRPLVVGPA